MEHIRMSHGTPTNESWHTWEWVMTLIGMRHGTHTNESCHIYEWVMAHMRMSHDTHRNASWITYEWVMAQKFTSHLIIRRSHVTCQTWIMSCSSRILAFFGLSCSLEGWQKRMAEKAKGPKISKKIQNDKFSQRWNLVMAHLRMSHGTHENAPRNTYEWVMAHIRMSHCTHTHESWHTWEWVITFIWMRHGTHTNESWHTNVRATLQSEWVMWCGTHECAMSHTWKIMSWQAHQRCRVEDKLALGALRGQSWVKCADSTSVCVWVLCVCLVCVWLQVDFVGNLGLDREWLRWVGSLNYRSLLQKSPIKQTIFCKRDL